MTKFWSTRFCCEREVGEDESLSLDGDPGFDCDSVMEHRPVVRAGVEFAAFPAGIDLWRQLRKERRVELASRKRSIEHLGVQAGNARAQPAVDHFARER